MQCTPLVSRTGELLGIVSTQFSKPHRPSEHELRLLDLYLVHATDTIERIRTIEELRQSEQLYRAIGDSIPYGIWIANAQGHNTYLSESFCALTGFKQADWANSSWMRALHPDDGEPTRFSWEDCVRTGCTWEREYRVKGVDGAWHPILSRGVPVRDGAGRANPRSSDAWASTDGEPAAIGESLPTTLGAIAHAAYHLGAIRLALASA